jgi:hypothetical protein
LFSAVWAKHVWLSLPAPSKSAILAQDLIAAAIGKRKALLTTEPPEQLLLKTVDLIENRKL